MNIAIKQPDIEYRAVWWWLHDQPKGIFKWDQECQHLHTDYQEFATGLSHSFDPITEIHQVCLDCDTILEDYND